MYAHEARYPRVAAQLCQDFDTVAREFTRNAAQLMTGNAIDRDGMPASILIEHR